MKKTISILLILVMTFLFVACQSKTITVTGTSINENGHLIIQYSDNTTKDLGEIKTKSIQSIDINDDGEMIVTYTDRSTENLGKIVSEDIWRERNDTIYATTKANLRAEASINATVSKTVTYKTSMQRIATNGTWNKVKIDNQVLYIKADCTTTNIQDVNFNQTTPTVVYAATGLFKKLYPCESMDTITGLIGINTELIKIEENESKTWIKVKFGTEEFYCKTSEITETKTETAG